MHNFFLFIIGPVATEKGKKMINIDYSNSNVYEHIHYAKNYIHISSLYMNVASYHANYISYT